MGITIFARSGGAGIGLSRVWKIIRNKGLPVPVLLLVVGSLWLLSCLLDNTTFHTYYVATYGSDQNPGTQSKPWKTIQKAAATMVAGDTVLIHGGTYYEKVTPQNSGSEGKYITYQDYGDGEVIIDAEGGFRDGCIVVDGKQYLQFIGLTLRNAGYYELNSAFAAFAGTNHVILDRITAENSRFGILLRGGKTSREDASASVSFVTIKNSNIRNNAAYGIFLYFKVTDTVIGPNNRIYNENETNGVPVDDQYGINLDTNYPGDPAHGSRRIVIIGNEIYGNRIQGIRPWNAHFVLIKDNYTHHNGATGIQVEDGCENIIVDGNRSEYNAQRHEYETGIWIDSTVNAVVQNNRVMGNQIGLMITSSERALIRKNIIVDNNRAPTGSNVMGVVLNAHSSNIIFVHNTLWNNGTSTSRGNLSFCIKAPVDRTVLKNNIFSESAGEQDLWLNCPAVSDFNNLYNKRDIVVSWSGESYSWAKYVDISGQDRHTILQNPLFRDPKAGDFSLSDPSPNIDSGSPLTRTIESGSGTVIALDDARYFTDGFGLIPGDTVMIGDVIAVIEKVDYQANTITIDRRIDWEKGASVNYDYAGKQPDRGAQEAGDVEDRFVTPYPVKQIGFLSK